MNWLKDYKQLKYPEGTQDGFIFSFASRGMLDRLGERCGIKRRKFLFIKEPDALYKIRLRNYGIESFKIKRNCDI